MDSINLKARAKINISLDVLGKRDDGYHDLSMIMQSVNLCDDIFIRKTEEEGITLKTNISWLPTDGRNLIYKAASEMVSRYEIKSGLFISLRKVIPVCAGLAGGSTDCAATLIGIRNLFNINIPMKELMALGKELGADVPFCLIRGTALAEGIGEKLTRIAPFPKCSILIVKPPVNVSTATVFKSYAPEKVTAHPDNEKLIYCIKKGDLKGTCENMCNVLESVTIEEYPVIAEIKKFMNEKGAMGAMMSGSGPTVFGIYRTYYSAISALKAVKEKFGIKECYVTNAFNIFE
ncbi:MAG: 4-(cytidine 5'-diphospho)-2-C-methyl-D-erythritol kinase [Firmicutes bacterium]|nr:4-(cytidine 5'-diphospho)-2-C-methyl-D-erythritol kinase [Bacillota bacterium]